MSSVVKTSDLKFQPHCLQWTTSPESWKKQIYVCRRQEVKWTELSKWLHYSIALLRYWLHYITQNQHNVFSIFSIKKYSLLSYKNVSLLLYTWMSFLFFIKSFFFRQNLPFCVYIIIHPVKYEYFKFTYSLDYQKYIIVCRSYGQQILRYQGLFFALSKF